MYQSYMIEDIKHFKNNNILHLEIGYLKILIIISDCGKEK
jgi:hypothetical protein